jgi:streptogramin lyase
MRTRRLLRILAATLAILLAHAAPYDVALDKNGDAWTGSMLNDRVLRLDPQTGKFTEYMLPRQTNIRRVFVDDSTTPPMIE